MIDLGITLTVGECPQVTEKDFSIVIAHRGNTLGLWATVHGCEVDLADSNFSYEYVIVFNGAEKLSDELMILREALRKEGKLGDFIHHAAPLSPPTARQLGTETANGKYLFFFDDHCIVSRGYFRRALEQMISKNLEFLHSTTHYLLGNGRHHYKLTLEHNFWCSEHPTNQEPGTEPYRIAMAGHGGWVARKTTFDRIGGYGPIGMFQGWGGEESYFDLKAAQFGCSNWLDPLLVHYHYPSNNRGYDRHRTADYFRNLMLSAYLIGGMKWLDTVFTSFNSDPASSDKNLRGLKEQAVHIGNNHAAWLQQRRMYSLDTVLEHFKQYNVAH